MQHKLRSKTQIIYQRMLNITKHGNRLNWNQRHRRPSHAHQLLCIEKERRPPVSKFLNIIKYISLTIQQWKTVHKWLDPQEVTTDITQANTKVLIACYNFPKVSRNSILVYIYICPWFGDTPRCRQTACICSNGVFAFGKTCPGVSNRAVRRPMARPKRCHTTTRNGTLIWWHCILQKSSRISTTNNNNRFINNYYHNQIYSKAL